MLALLNYDKFELVSIFLKNRMAIYHAVRYHQSQNEKDKEHIMEEMKMDGFSFGKRKGKASEKIKPEPEK